MGLTVNKNSPSIKKIKTMKPNKSGRSPWTFEYSRKKKNPRYERSALKRKAYRKERRVKVHEHEIGGFEDSSQFEDIESEMTAQEKTEYAKHVEETGLPRIVKGTWECVKDQWEKHYEEKETSIVVKFGSDIFRLKNTYFYIEGNDQCLVKCIDGTYYVFPCDIALDEPDNLFSEEHWIRDSIGILETVHIPRDPQTQKIAGWFRENSENVTIHDDYYMSDYEMNDDDRAQYYD